MKKLCALALVLCLGCMMSMGAYAADVPSEIDWDSLMGQRIQIRDGDTHVLFEDETGVTYAQIEAPLAESMSTRATGTDVSTPCTVNVRHKNSITGKDTLVVKIVVTCYWYKDGVNSRIDRLHGKYDIYDSNYSCEWNTNYNRMSDTYAAMGIDVNRGSETVTYVIDAFLNTTVTPPTIDMSYIAF